MVIAATTVLEDNESNWRITDCAQNNFLCAPEPVRSFLMTIATSPHTAKVGGLQAENHFEALDKIHHVHRSHLYFKVTGAVALLPK